MILQIIGWVVFIVENVIWAVSLKMASDIAMTPTIKYLNDTRMFPHSDQIVDGWHAGVHNSRHATRQ